MVVVVIRVIQFRLGREWLSGPNQIVDKTVFSFSNIFSAQVTIHAFNLKLQMCGTLENSLQRSRNG